MLEILLTPKILGPPKSGALGLSLFSLMVMHALLRFYIDYHRVKILLALHEAIPTLKFRS